MNNVVIAANGLVGRAVARELSARGRVSTGTCFSRDSNSLRHLDITNFKEVKSFLYEERPSVVYLCANMSGGVNRCEAEGENSYIFHVKATENIVNLCKGLEVKLVYISSDYVFSDRALAYSENDDVCPMNAYGRFKVEAEELIQSSLKEYVIARTTNVFGWDPDTKTPSYFMSVYRTMNAGDLVFAPRYLHGNPSYVEDLARVLVSLAESKSSGVFHVVGPQNMSRYEWVEKICEKFSFDKSLLKEMKERGSIPRPLKAELSTKKLSDTIDYTLSDLDSALDVISRVIDSEGRK